MSKTNRVALVLAIGAGSGGIALPASALAASKSLTNAQAVRAVEREVRAEYEWSDVLEVTCQKLNSKRFKCRFSGLTTHDSANGDTGGHSGLAAVTKYSEGIDVVISGYREGGR